MRFDPRRLRLAAIFLTAFVVLWPLARHLRVNTTESAPKGLYLVTSRPPGRGSWVTVCLPEELGHFSRERDYLAPGECPGSTVPVLKLLAALPGDRVELSRAGLSVNGRLFPETAPRRFDRHGRVLPEPPYGTHEVGPEDLWLISKTPIGWDSRYWGPVPLDGLVGTATAVWTISEVAEP